MPEIETEGTPQEEPQQQEATQEIDYSKLDLKTTLQKNPDFQKAFDQKVSEAVNSYAANQATKQKEAEEKAAKEKAEKAAKESMDKAPDWAKPILDQTAKLNERLEAIEREKADAKRRVELDKACDKAGLPKSLWRRVSDEKDIEAILTDWRESFESGNIGGDFNLPGQKGKGKQDQLTKEQLEHCERYNIKPEDYLAQKKRLKEDELEPVDRIEHQ